VVMPVRNSEPDLAESVRSILGQDYPGELEIVLAVGPSRDRTVQFLERVAASDSRIIVVPNPTGHRPRGLNAAIKASRHAIVARVDGHALLPPGYLRTAVHELEQTGAASVGGIMAAQGVTPFQQAVAWAMTFACGAGAAEFRSGGHPGSVDSVYLGVYRRAAIDRVGGYNETCQCAEDWELNQRIRLAGGVIWFQPELRVTYRPRASMKALAEQYFSCGRWRRVVARQHAGTINPRYLEPVAVLALALGGLAGIAGLAALLSGPAGAWPAAVACGLAVPALYAAGILGVAAMTARYLRLGAVAWIPAVLATMHIAGGIGFLASPRRLMPGNGSSSARRSRPASAAARPAVAAAPQRLPGHRDR
jgi:succinoglycan biosynthesis protein ExoA